MSSASGLSLLKKEEQNCMYTSSFGTGELIKDAINKGLTTINLYIGGSATNDGGVGIASALGFQFYDRLKKQLILNYQFIPIFLHKCEEQKEIILLIMVLIFLYLYNSAKPIH